MKMLHEARKIGRSVQRRPLHGLAVSARDRGEGAPFVNGEIGGDILRAEGRGQGEGEKREDGEARNSGRHGRPSGGDDCLSFEYLDGCFRQSVNNLGMFPGVGSARSVGWHHSSSRLGKRDGKSEASCARLDGQQCPSPHKETGQPRAAVPAWFFPGVKLKGPTSRKSSEKWGTLLTL